MAVIQPGLFLIQQRFPACKDDLRRLYRGNETFQAICHSYQKCSKAIDYWSTAEDEKASFRQREYEELLKELEREILQSLEDGG